MSEPSPYQCDITKCLLIRHATAKGRKKKSVKYSCEGGEEPEELQDLPSAKKTPYFYFFKPLQQQPSCSCWGLKHPPQAKHISLTGSSANTSTTAQIHNLPAVLANTKEHNLCILSITKSSQSLSLCWGLLPQCLLFSYSQSVLPPIKKTFSLLKSLPPPG